MDSRFKNDFNRSAEAAAIRFAKELEKYPEEIGISVGIILPNLINGCSWGFVKDDNRDFVRCLNKIAKNPELSCAKVKGGYLVIMNLNYLLDVLNKTAKGLVKNRDLELASKHRKEALSKLEKWMQKGKEGKIGIYCLNDSPYITVDGVTYNAFCVTLVDLLSICVRNNYKLKLKGAPRSVDAVYKRINRVIGDLEVAPSGNALFVEVCKG